MIVNFYGDIIMQEIADAVDHLQEMIGNDSDVNIIYGSKYDATNKDQVTVTVIATGLSEEGKTVSEPAKRTVPSRTGIGRTGFSSSARQNARTSSVVEKTTAAERVTNDSNNTDIKIPEFLIKGRK